MSGFNTANREWIWSVYSDESESLEYFQFFAYEGSNSNSTMCRLRPASISKELYEQIPATDLRRNLFLNPQTDAYNTATGVAGSALAARARQTFGSRLYSTSQILAYMQFKNMAKALPGVGELNLFRSSEMYLIQAEADCHLEGKENEARQLLVELNRTSGRDPEYTCDKTGSDLLNEVRLYNRIELWGEGFSYLDNLRLNTGIDRRGGGFDTNDVFNIPAGDPVLLFQIPESEYEYNKQITLAEQNTPGSVPTAVPDE